MPFPLLIPALGALANAASGAIGGAASAGDKAAQQRMLERILAEYEGIDVPTLERLNAEQLGPGATENVSTDPRLRYEQQQSLGTLGEVAQGGHTAETDAAMNRILAQAAKQESAGHEAILGNMRARGVAGSGAELAAALSNQQASADRTHTSALDQGAMAQKRMLDAVLQKGQMAGQMRGQDFGENSAKAQAHDAIARYNADARTRMNAYNASLPQQQFNMKMQLAGGKAGALGSNAAGAGQRASQTAQTFAGIGEGISEGANAYARSQEPPRAPYAGSSDSHGYGYQGYDSFLDENGIPKYTKVR